MTVAAILLISVLVVLAVAVAVVFTYAFRRNGVFERKMQMKISGKYRKQVALAEEFLQNHAAETVETRAFDGLRLVGRFVPCENARGTLLCFHGWRSSPEIDFGAAYGLYHSLGLNLLLVSQRAQGDSEGEYLTFGVRERRDVLSWLAWHRENRGEEPVFLTGMSMGATTVLMACGENLPDNVRGVIADCGFTSPYEIVRAVIKANHVPTWPLLPLMNLLTKWLAGFDMKEFSTLDAMKTAKIPIFMAHGEADTFVPCEMSRRTFAACRSEDKSLLLAPGAKHGESYLKLPQQYTETLTAFVERNIRRGDPV